MHRQLSNLGSFDVLHRYDGTYREMMDYVVGGVAMRMKITPSRPLGSDYDHFQPNLDQRIPRKGSPNEN